MTNFARALAAFTLALVVSGCAGILRHPDIADVRQNSGHYSNRTVTVDGRVTSAWGVPLVPFKMYKVDDGTGERLPQPGVLPKIATIGAKVRRAGPPVGADTDVVLTDLGFDADAIAGFRRSGAIWK